MLVGGAWLFVEGATGIARSFGISEAVIGLSLVAIGTSLPELATSIVATMRKHGDVIVGNVVGSSIFNMFLRNMLNPNGLEHRVVFLFFKSEVQLL